MVNSKDFEALGIKAAEPTLMNGKLLPYHEDPDRKVHGFNILGNRHIWKAGMSHQDVIDYSRIHNVPLKALCGELLVANVNPNNREGCNECYTISKFIKENFNYDHDNG